MQGGHECLWEREVDEELSKAVAQWHRRLNLAEAFNMEGYGFKSIIHDICCNDHLVALFFIFIFYKHLFFDSILY